MNHETIRYQDALNLDRTARRAYETDLAARAAEGDSGAFRAIAEVHGGRIYRVCERIVKNEADALDAAQEVLILLHRKLGAFRGDSDLSTWIHRVAINVSLMSLRRNKRRSVLRSLDDLPLVESSSLEEQLEDREKLRQIENAWQKVSKKHRRALELRVVEDQPLEEIAGQLGISVPATKSRIHRARLELSALAGI
ncbi:MAG: sigma-70 family RNA polymerase sigma factor [bacterium]